MKISILLSVFCLLMTACAGPITMAPQGSSLEIQREAQRQKEIVYKSYIRDQDKLFNISFPIRAANVEFCGKVVAPMYGMTAWNLSTVKSDFRTAARNIYNLQDRLAVQSVADGSPAGQAGIRSGDFIISINGIAIPTGAGALEKAAQVLKAAQYRSSQMMIERDGKQITKSLWPVRGCDIPVILDYTSNDTNAFTDGERIVISKGILRFAAGDSEVALVVAHELAHASLDHVNKMKQNAMAGSIGGLAVDSLLAAAGVSTGNQFSRMGSQIGATRHSVGFEQEADYVGMYFMERAGYSTKNVAYFWRRMAAESPNGIYTRRSHPTSPERFIAIEHTSKEIADKKARGQKLVPNMRVQ